MFCRLKQRLNFFNFHIRAAFIVAFFFFFTSKSPFLDLGVGPFKNVVIPCSCVRMRLWNHVHMRLFGAPYAYFIFSFLPPTPTPPPPASFL